jgi:hypothetical protein
MRCSPSNGFNFRARASGSGFWARARVRGSVGVRCAGHCSHTCMHMYSYRDRVECAVTLLGLGASASVDWGPHAQLGGHKSFFDWRAWRTCFEFDVFEEETVKFATAINASSSSSMRSNPGAGAGNSAAGSSTSSSAAAVERRRRIPPAGLGAPCATPKTLPPRPRRRFLAARVSTALTNLRKLMGRLIPAVLPGRALHAHTQTSMAAERVRCAIRRTRMCRQAAAEAAVVCGLKSVMVAVLAGTLAAQAHAWFCGSSRVWRRVTRSNRLTSRGALFTNGGSRFI